MDWETLRYPRLAQVSDRGFAPGPSLTPSSHAPTNTRSASARDPLHCEEGLNGFPGRLPGAQVRRKIDLPRWRSALPVQTSVRADCAGVRCRYLLPTEVRCQTDSCRNSDNEPGGFERR